MCGQDIASTSVIRYTISTRITASAFQIQGGMKSNAD